MSKNTPNLTRRGLFGLLGGAVAVRSAAPLKAYRAEIVLLSEFRILDWSRTQAVFVHDELKQEFRTVNLVIAGKENVVADMFRITFVGSGNYLTPKLEPKLSAFTGRNIPVDVSIRYFNPEQKKQYTEFFDEGAIEETTTAKQPVTNDDRPNKPVQAAKNALRTRRN